MDLVVSLEDMYNGNFIEVCLLIKMWWRHVCMHTQAYTQTYIYVHTHTHMHTNTCTHANTCTYLHIQTQHTH